MVCLNFCTGFPQSSQWVAEHNWKSCVLWNSEGKHSLGWGKCQILSWMNVEYNNKGRMLLLNGRMEEARFSSDVHLAHHPSSSVVSDVLTVFLQSIRSFSSANIPTPYFSVIIWSLADDTIPKQKSWARVCPVSGRSWSLPTSCSGLSVVWASLRSSSLFVAHGVEKSAMGVLWQHRW